MERNTRQRSAILKALKTANRPLSPQEVLTRAQDDVKSLGIATVYRTLNSFEKSGKISAVQLPGDPMRYELSGKGHHHHFRCRKCHRVFEVEGCVGGIEENLTPEGFLSEGHDLLLFGVCRECLDQNL